MPLRSRSLEIDDLKIHYQTAGSGPPVVLLHGLLGGSFCWRHNLAALAQQHTVFAVDLPGHGLSDASPETDCRMARQAGRVLRFMRELRLHDAALMATSYGAAVAMWLATMEQIRALVLVAPANPWSEFGRGRIEFLNTRFGGRFLRAVFPVSDPVHRIALRRMYGTPAKITAEARRGYVANSVRPGRARNALATLRTWPADMETLRQLIQKITAPTLLISGGKDRAVDPRSCEILRQQIPNCELITLPDLGHLPFEESPEQFNQIVLEFLGKNI
jgi:pimeloyl-ACP methyl ester carboxylesterase